MDARVVLFKLSGSLLVYPFERLVQLITEALEEAQTNETK